MDFRLIAILCVFGLFMVLIGNNPAQDARDAREAAARGKDPIMRSIEEDMEQNRGGEILEHFKSGTAIMEDGRGSDIDSVAPAPPSFPMASGGSGAGSYQDSPQPDNALPYMNPSQSPPQDAPPAPAANNGYYPPPPGTPAQPQQARPAPAMAPPVGNYLQNGQRIEYAGDMVYAIDAYGNRVSLQDGDYQMQGGGVLRIRDGRRIANFR